jgi:glycosyltransferase involved in cell wall biosynthesis
MYPTAAHPTSGIFVAEQVRGLQEIQVDVEVFFVDRLKLGMTCYYRMRHLLPAAVRTFQPDLVHVMYGGVMASEVTRCALGRPILVTFHGSDLFGENHSGLLRKCISHYAVRCSCHAARNAKGVVVVSRWLQGLLAQRVRHGNVRVIPCGVDLERFKPMDQVSCRERLGWRDRVFHVLFSNNGTDPVKRPQLARAATELLNRSGVPTELHYLHGFAYDQVPIWLNASDVLILTSYREGASTIVKEALACNVPVVSTDVGDVAERIEGIDGCYLSEATPEGFADKLRKVHAGPSRVASRTRMQDLSLQLIAIRLRAFYEDLLA